MSEYDLQDPSLVGAVNDPGDETQRNFRYQHACGAILLIAGATGKTPYKAVWCEHHEDLLAERSNGKYDAYQVKTRRPENGDWDLGDKEIILSIKRFVFLFKRFGDHINKFVLLSNAEFMKCGIGIVDKKKVKRCVPLLLEAVKNWDEENGIISPFDEVVKELSTEFSCSDVELIEVLKRTKHSKGPSREDFEASVAHSHLAQLGECRIMSPGALNSVRDELIQRIYQASSLHADNPDQHLHDIGSGLSPIQRAKRLPIEVVFQCIEHSREFVFKYQPSENIIVLGSLDSSRNTNTLKRKFALGNLDSQFQTMQRRSLSAESRLLELSAMNSQEAIELLNQLEAVVQGECDEAEVATLASLKSNEDPIYGATMLSDVHVRLKEISIARPNLVQNQPYETLIGIAGLLTEKCTVWWSKRVKLLDVA